MGKLRLLWSLASSVVGGIPMIVWVYLAATAAFGVWTLHWYNAGYAAAETVWIAKQLEAKIAKLELEIKTQKDADAIEDKLRTELADENEQQKKVIDEFLANNEKRTDKCPLGDDAGKLNGL